ncbi:Acyl-CoA synthetase (AMP-forming)/AMP-acid ligase II [Amycolatopsis rubida]|uniref:Acyl-CoA synthetase (AMP-forming)/AMP-acid ligase II n=2 Tax=Amycolatopsis rubida TaxID=112413 RepID=A0A1I5TCT4_9PSEU|nr:Acyl-CoA synthetase (AMP-forming)/AMP-acid ligase II [Amycolatopsis rubida]
MALADARLGALAAGVTRMSPTPLARLCTQAYAEFADRPAIRDSRRELTYGELGSRARRIAQAFRALGAERGARAVLLGPNSCEWAEAYHGLVLGGGVRVGLLPRLHPAELAQIAADAEPAFVLADGTWLAEHGTAWIPPQVKEIIVLGEGAEGIPFEEFVASGSDDELPLPDAEDDAWLLYTSGSTGLPKGVRVPHRTVGALVRNAREVLPPLGLGDAALHTAPISHFSGGIADVLTASGGLNIYAPKFDAAEIADAAAGGEVTVLPLVPTMITMLLEELARRGSPSGSIGNVRILPYAGSAIQPDRAAKARAYFGEAMQQLYGASEAQLPIATLRPEEHVETRNERGLPRLASAGRVTAHVEVEIVDADRRPVPPGATGEIRTRGAHVSAGYWRNPEATAETFADGWAHTGDVGCLDEHGYLFILDRRKDMIITGGFNVYPREIENVVAELPGIREVAVVGAPDERWGEAITAFVSAEPGNAVSADGVLAHCRARLGGYKVPKKVVFVEDLPKTGTGKIQKQILREKLWTGLRRRV